MSCHLVHEHAAAAAKPLRLRARPLRIALVGQPNVGESVVFTPVAIFSGAGLNYVLHHFGIQF
jgi:hypothetical protein